MKSQIQLDTIRQENQGLKDKLQYMKKNEEFSLSEIERMKSKIDDQTTEISVLKAQLIQLKDKNMGPRNTTEMLSNIEFWKRKYEQLEKEFNSELNNKEINIKALYKSEYVSTRLAQSPRTHSPNLTHIRTLV